MLVDRVVASSEKHILNNFNSSINQSVVVKSMEHHFRRQLLEENYLFDCLNLFVLSLSFWNLYKQHVFWYPEVFGVSIKCKFCSFSSLITFPRWTDENQGDWTLFVLLIVFYFLFFRREWIFNVVCFKGIEISVYFLSYWLS